MWVVYNLPLKLPYNTMQATRLLQHNNPSQNNYINHKYKV